MIVYVDDANRIKAVGSTDDETLIALEITDEFNPFQEWSTAKICSYRCTVEDGRVTMMTPYRDSQALDFINEIGKDRDEKTQALEILFGAEEVEE